MPHSALQHRIQSAKSEFERLRIGKDDLLRILDESELPESVYNSNAIENSTLTLEDTERILLAVEISRNLDLREVHEAQNLARVSEYIRSNHEDPLTPDKILLLHRMLLANIDEAIAGRFRQEGEFVRVGTHVAPPPEQVPELITELLVSYASNVSGDVVDNVAKAHLEFERVHPFNDGNGRIGRVVINYQLYRLWFPPVIIRNKGKMKYYAMLREYDANRKVSMFASHLAVLILESLHRRIAYLRGAEIVSVAQYARQNSVSVNALLNKARRQIIPAFREHGKWKIPNDFS